MILWISIVAVAICVTGVTGVIDGDETDAVGTVNGVVEGEVVQESVDGVSVRMVGGRLRVVPWYEIRAVEDGWEISEGFEEMAHRAAIGHARRERGDLSGCAEMYAGLGVGLVGSQSDMAIEVFGGLLDEAVMRGDFYDASVAMAALESLPILVLKSGLDGFDGRYRVHVGVPLLAGLDRSHRLESVGRVIMDGGTSGGVVVRAFGMVNSVDGDGEDVTVLIQDMKTRQGIDVQFRQGLELYINMLAAQEHPELAARDEARRWLGSRSASKAGTWIDAWCRMALGVSYIRESERSGNDETLSRGVVELVHVMVRFGDEFPVLWGMAEDIAVGALIDAGRVDEAAGLARGLAVMTTDSEY